MIGINAWNNVACGMDLSDCMNKLDMLGLKKIQLPFLNRSHLLQNKK